MNSLHAYIASIGGSSGGGSRDRSSNSLTELDTTANSSISQSSLPNASLSSVASEGTRTRPQRVREDDNDSEYIALLLRDLNVYYHGKLEKLNTSWRG